ncbi:glycerophosphodiester phosphodiesterase [Ureibacillus sp. MALMAid1270]|uniref:glycerophosphodiester phosphodiesterase n=1 Tax=Ureibacillus sp. MALMAid1270 TaxID=3411629 RepID=UPI003BA7F26C
MRRVLTVMILAALFIPISASVLSYAEEYVPRELKGYMTNIAHRGASAYAPENTMSAFYKAIQMGADYIEFDVQMSKDGIPVIIHDSTLNRTTNGNGYISDYTLKQLKSLDAGSWYGKEYVGETIPTLDEFLVEFGGKVNILIELKYPELYPGIEEKVAITLREFNLVQYDSHEVIIQSFNHESLKLSKKLLPEIPHAVLVSKDWRKITIHQLEEIATFADYFNPSLNMVTSELVELVHHTNMSMYAYTVRNPSEAGRLYSLGVDGIITDFPDYAKLVVK